MEKVKELHNTTAALLNFFHLPNWAKADCSTGKYNIDATDICFY